MSAHDSVSLLGIFLLLLLEVRHVQGEVQTWDPLPTVISPPHDTKTVNQSRREVFRLNLESFFFFFLRVSSLRNDYNLDNLYGSEEAELLL